MSTTDLEPKPANSAADTTAPPAPDIGVDGSKEAIGLPIFGGIKIGWDALLTTLPIYIGLIAVWIYFDVLTGGTFTSSRNISEMFQEYSYKPVLAIGVVFVLLLGEIDLSLGYLTLLSITLTAAFSANLHFPAAAAILAAIAICIALGLAQGLLIAWVRMPAFVVTLGGFLIFEGIAYNMVGGATINVFDTFITGLGSTFLSPGVGIGLATVAVLCYILYGLNGRRGRARAGLVNAPIARFVVGVVALAVLLEGLVLFVNTYRGVPLALVILGALATFFWFFSRRLPFGRHIYAVGGNLEASRRAGINTTGVRWIVFGISGLMAGIAGVMLVGYGQAASTTTAGPDLLLDVISIAVIGGVSLTGGKGSVWAVLLGGLVIASVDSGLNLLGTISPYFVYVIKGAILLLAILIDVVGKRRGGLAIRR